MERNIVGTLFFFVAVIISEGAFAQQKEVKVHQSSPIPLEVALGSEGWTSQLVIDKKFAENSKLGFLGLTYIKANYDNDEYLRESVNLAFAKYDVLKHVSVLSGAAFNSQWGFRPYIGGQLAYQSKSFMGALITGYYLTETHNYEALAMVEFRPVIKNYWSLFSRAQGLYNQNTIIGKHDRSYLYGRLGLSYKTFSLGCAYNYDCYGLMKLKEHQWGIFISTLLR
jgi:hypothetical protein